MPVAVSSNKVCGTYVTDIRYREDATDWDEPEDLPFSNDSQLSGTKVCKKYEETVSSSYGG